MIELYPVFIQEGGRMVLSVVFLAVAWWNPLGADAAPDAISGGAGGRRIPGVWGRG
jgi:hypothetical protein